MLMKPDVLAARGQNLDCNSHSSTKLRILIDCHSSNKILTLILLLGFQRDRWEWRGSGKHNTLKIYSYSCIYSLVGLFTKRLYP
jgi:hypothetical protein